MTPGIEPVGRGVVWAAVVLTIAYLVVHLGMLQRSLSLWPGLLHAVFFGH